MSTRPICVHPDNPRYFLFRGQPTMLITSAEHYGAVLNLDFDYVRYLEELQRCGMMLTRIFVGSYREVAGSFSIEHNTLAPAPERFICPWARSAEPGYPGGGNRFDLKQWDAGYFARLHDFLSQASRRGIVVEVVLFCSYYQHDLWVHSPLNSASNCNGIGAVPRELANSLADPALLAAQCAMVQKLVQELNGYDNLYYEICNEPYSTQVADDWQFHIADTIVETEHRLPYTHLIAQNIANGSTTARHAHPAVAILNYHYCSPPDAVAWNAGQNRVISCDETGFRGSDDAAYRREAWHFMLAGGGVYNNLDYSFSVGHEDGQDCKSAPGGGGAALRRQLGVLKEFLSRVDFLRLHPDYETLRTNLFPHVQPRILSRPGETYAIYIDSVTQDRLMLDLPGGAYRFAWISPRSGGIIHENTISHNGGTAVLPLPYYVEDVAVHIERR